MSILPFPVHYRPVNFVRPPFSFPDPPPERKLRDYPDGQPERYMYLWTYDEIAPRITVDCLATLRNFPTPQAASPGAKLKPTPAAKNRGHLPTYIANSKYPATLSKVMKTAHDKLGIFHKHPPRAFEYPWIIEHIPQTTGLVIDLGAGLSPFP